jgi:Holliday junction resolvasome RuvABC endonuclease subunit
MLQKKQSFKILAIKPGTKDMPMAVLDNQDLVYWANKRIRRMGATNSQTIRKMKYALDKLIEFWKPEVIAVENIFYTQSKRTKLLNVLAEEIKNIAKERKIKAYFYSPVEVREFICKKEKTNKMNTARLLAGHYPWLNEKYERENKKRWYQFKSGLRIFDAIAVGLFCFHQLTKKKSQKNNKLNYAQKKKDK